MRTITSWIKELNEKIKSVPIRGGWYDVRYIPQYRYLGFSGDGLLQFRGTLSKDGKSIYITAVNGKCGMINGLTITPQKFQDWNGNLVDNKAPHAYLAVGFVISLEEYESAVLQVVKDWHNEKVSL